MRPECKRMTTVLRKIDVVWVNLPSKTDRMKKETVIGN